MTSRQKRPVALIECKVDASVIEHMALSAGLVAEPAPKSGQFFLFNTGRNLASELGTPLFAAFVRALDEAAENCLIPKWTIIETQLAT
jgi:hypothetical protein